MSHVAAVPGAQSWVQRYNGAANTEDVAYSVAVGPGSGKMFVTGWITSATSEYQDYATIAYSG
jgi:hypothetical protein